MDGVSILNEIEHVTTVAGEFNDSASGLAWLITIIICAIVGFVLGKEEREAFCGTIVGALAGVVFGILVAGSAGALFAGPSQTKTTTYYEVTLDDSVSMNEFCDKYNIIEQRGQIFVIEEKEK